MASTTIDPESVAMIIKSALVANKEYLIYGVPIRQLDHEYRQFEEKSIPFRQLGFPSLLDFLRSLERRGDIKIVQKNGIDVVHPCINESIAHVTKLVAGQNSPSKKRPRGGRRPCRPRPHESFRPPRIDSKILTDIINLVKSQPDGIHISRLMNYIRNRTNYPINEQQLLRQLQGVRHEVIVNGNTILPVRHVSNEKISQPRNSLPTNGNSLPTNENSSNVHGAPLERTPVTSRPTQFYDNNDDGYPENIRGTGSSPTNGNFEGNVDETSETLIDANANDCDRKDEYVEPAGNDDTSMLVNERTKFRLEKLIQQHPEGIWCAELPLLYRKEYGVLLNYEDLGFDNLIDYVVNLPNIFRYVRPQKLGDFKLFDAKAAEPNVRSSERPERLSLAALHDIYQYENDDDYAIPSALTPETTSRLVPDGVMTIGETVAQISVTELFRDKLDMLDVLVADVVTPTLFWIQVLKRVPKFEQFMLELHEFYTVHANEYVIPMIILEKGFNCACLYDGKWHRGMITAVKPDYTVTIMFYDYGTVKSYPPDNVRFLHRSFSRLPAQAIPCGLYNIKPKFGSSWPYRACQAFVEMVLSEPMVAMRGSIDVDNNSMLIALTDTSGPDDVHINDWMVNQGYAVYGKMGDTVDMEEMRSDTPPVTDVSEEIPNLDLEGMSEILRNLSSLNVANDSPKMFKCVADLTRAILQVGSMIKAAASNGLSPDADPAATAAFDSWQAEASETFGRRDDINVLERLYQSIHIDDQTRRQFADSSCPPIPPLPNRKSSIETNFPQTGKNASANDENRAREDICTDLNSKKQDSNLNSSSTNPFVSSTSPETPAFVPRSLNFASQSISEKENYPPSNYHNKNDLSSIFERETKIEAPKKSSTTRKLFENSVERCCANFFERLDSNTKPKYRETNPFKIDIENNNYREDSLETSTNPLSSSRRSTNPFLIETATIDREMNVPTKIVYEGKPVRYDLSSENKFRNKAEDSVPFVGTKAKKLEASKMSDVSSWIEKGQRSSADFIGAMEEIPDNSRTVLPDRSYDCDFTNRRGPQYEEPKFVERERKSEENVRNFIETRLTKQNVIIIELDGEGWITVEEFVAAFTNSKSPDGILRLLKARGIWIPFRFLERWDYLELFDQLDRTSLGVRRDSHSRIKGCLHLVPIKSLIKILLELGVVDLAEVKRATTTQTYPKTSSALFDACNVINAYGNFRTSVRGS